MLGTYHLVKTHWRLLPISISTTEGTTCLIHWRHSKGCWAFDLSENDSSQSHSNATFHYILKVETGHDDFNLVMDLLFTECSLISHRNLQRRVWLAGNKIINPELQFTSSKNYPHGLNWLGGYLASKLLWGALLWSRFFVKESNAYRQTNTIIEANGCICISPMLYPPLKMQLTVKAL